MNKDVGLAMKLIKNPIMFSKIKSLLNDSLDKLTEKLSTLAKA